MSKRLHWRGTARLLMWSYNAWEVPDANSPTGEPRVVGIKLEIQGTERDGYHLVMSPDGAFTADNWYPTKGEAIDDARKVFGVQPEAWASGD